MSTPVHELELPELNLVGDESREELRAEIDRVRGEHWLAKAPLGYSVTSYDNVVSILRDKRFHSAVSLIPQLAGIDESELSGRSRRSILSEEGDAHSRLRRIVSSAFTPKAAEPLRPFMADVMNELVDPVESAGKTEAIADICDPYPIPIICELLGAPREDWKLFSGWATDVFRIFSNNLREDMPVIAAARDELDGYVSELITARRADPREDLLTDLIAAEEEGDRLSSEELLMMAEAVLLAGTDTTRNQLGCALALFADFPDQWARLAEQPELAPRAVEEVMRYLGAIRGTGRFAAEDTEYNDVVFPKGTLLFPSFVASNFDGERFADANRFDITRSGESPHLTFGSGIHFCLGAWLARAELQEALIVLSQRLTNLRPDGPVTWKPTTFGIWGPEKLPLAFD